MDETKNSPRQGQDRELPQIIAILIACLTSFTCGTLFNWPSPSIPILIADNAYLRTDLEMASYLTVVPPCAAILTAFPAQTIVDRFGRKNTLLLIAVPHLLSWMLIGVGGSIWMLYASRFLTGAADTLIFAALPVYIGEIATPRVRGSWGNAMTFILFTGGLSVNVIGSYLDIRETACVLGVVPLVFVAAFHFMPESPYYCVIKGQTRAAKESLAWLRGRSDVEEEYAEIAAAVKRQLAASGTYKELFSARSNRRAVLVGAIMRFTQQFSGISAFSVYTQYLFQEAGGEISASTSAIAYSATMTLTSLLAAALLDKLGRRKAMAISGTGCTAILFSIAAFLTTKTTQISWFPILGMTAFIVLYSTGLGIVPTLMLGELFSSNVKGKALAVMNVFFGLYIAASTKVFHLLESNFGLYAPFYFYGGTCLVGTVVCYCIMPETKGRTLDEIQLELEGAKVVKGEVS